MAPDFNPDDRVVINKLAYFFSSPKIGDVVAFRDPKQTGKILLKRVQKIYNTDKYFVAGDNSTDSRDSGSFGTVSRKLIVGKALTKY